MAATEVMYTFQFLVVEVEVLYNAPSGWTAENKFFLDDIIK